MLLWCANCQSLVRKLILDKKDLICNGIVRREECMWENVIDERKKFTFDEVLCLWNVLHERNSNKEIYFVHNILFYIYDALDITNIQY